MLGRLHLLQAELDKARNASDQSMALTMRAGWTAFMPRPESLRAHVDLFEGDLNGAQKHLDHAFALGCHIGDPCWEGVAARGLGLLHAARGETDRAIATLRDARARCTRFPDGYVWLDAWILDALATITVGSRDTAAHEQVEELDRLAARSGMREHLARAQLLRAQLGERHLPDP